VAFELAEDRRRGKGGEGDASLGVETVDRVQQAKVGDLEEVVEGLAGAPVALGEAAGEGKMAPDQLLADGRVLPGRETRPQLLFAGKSKLGVRFGSPEWPTCLASPRRVPSDEEPINGKGSADV
jgi:hypothetical protein